MKKLHGDESESLLYTTLNYVSYNFFFVKQMRNLHFFSRHRLGAFTYDYVINFICLRRSLIAKL